MVRLTVNEVHGLMKRASHLRHVSLVAPVDHGKSALLDCLTGGAGILIADEATEPPCDADGCRDEPQEAVLTLKPTSTPLLYSAGPPTMPEPEAGDYLINVVECPGHAELSQEVAAALRVTDGAVAVLDCTSVSGTETGLGLHNEFYLLQALRERVVPVVLVNKLDFPLAQRWDPEGVYLSLRESLDGVTALIAAHDAALPQSPAPWSARCRPERGAVAFGSGLQGWGFVLPQFGRMYSAKFGVSAEAMTARLWGDHFYDVAAKKWRRSGAAEDGRALPRAFCQFVWKPLAQLCDAVLCGRTETYRRMVASLGVELLEGEWGLTGKALLKCILRQWLPLKDAVLGMVVQHLPAPVTAQRYRAEALYAGGASADPYLEAVRQCDPAGPLCLYISRLVPTADYRRFVTFGRVFSGTCRTGQPCRVLPAAAGAAPRTAEGHGGQTIPHVLVRGGRYHRRIEDVPCGNLVELVGVGAEPGLDQFIVNAATVVAEGVEGACPLKGPTGAPPPVVRVAVRPQRPEDLPRLVAGLRRLSQCDPSIEACCEETGEHVLLGPGELRLDLCLGELREYCGAVELQVSEPAVIWRETVTAPGPVHMSKSPNRHNRVWGKAEPLDPALVRAIEAGRVRPGDDARARAARLADEFGWDAADARRIWCFGPGGAGPNLLVDQTRGVAHLWEVRQYFESAWNCVTAQGALCEERVRGMQYTVTDVVHVADAIHRGGGQWLPMCRRNFIAAQVAAGPRLMEPVFSAEVYTPAAHCAAVSALLRQRRGTILSEGVCPAGTYGDSGRGYNRLRCSGGAGGTDWDSGVCGDAARLVLRACVPVADAFGLGRALHDATGGAAVLQCAFSHWTVRPGDPRQPDSDGGAVVRGLRTRKGLREEVPDLDAFVDKY